jgi:hypothetical protein
MTGPVMHGRHEVDPRRPAELLRLAMLAVLGRRRLRRAEQLRLWSAEATRAA